MITFSVKDPHSKMSVLLMTFDGEAGAMERMKSHIFLLLFPGLL